MWERVLEYRKQLPQQMFEKDLWFVKWERDNEQRESMGKKKYGGVCKNASTIASSTNPNSWGDVKKSRKDMGFRVRPGLEFQEHPTFTDWSEAINVGLLVPSFQGQGED